jgi:hypothetical protein
VSADVVLQTEHASGFQAWGFAGVPAARRSWICLASSGSDQGRDHVRQLREALEAALMGSNAGVTTEAIQSAAPSALDLTRQRDRRNVLVLVGSADRPFTRTPWHEAWQSDADNAAVMVALPAGRYEAMFDATIAETDLWRRINASVWRSTIGEVLPGILARAEVTSPVSRVFVSYRRLETLPIALQLFDRLTHEGFEVFLDRFSIPPGYDFQRRLTQELEDKSMVVLLESRHLRDSQWTQHEIDFAKRTRLGLATIRMPDVTPAEALPSTTIGPVLELKDPTDFAGPSRTVPDPARAGVTVTEWPALTKDAEDRVVAEIKQAHADALFRRRHRLRTDLVEALRAGGIPTQYTAVGPLIVSHSPDEHLVWVTTRPPEVDDFRSVYAADAARTKPSPQSRGVIVGPMAAHEPDRQQRLKWLESLSRCASFDEGDLAAFVRRVKDQPWP